MDPTVKSTPPSKATGEDDLPKHRSKQLDVATAPQATFDPANLKLRKRGRGCTANVSHCLVPMTSMPSPVAAQFVGGMCGRLNKVEDHINEIQKAQQETQHNQQMTDERLAAFAEQLQCMEEEMKSTITCRVCYKRCPIEGFSYVNMLGCGHAFCSICCFSMKECAICRTAVVGKFKLFI